MFPRPLGLLVFVLAALSAGAQTVRPKLPAGPTKPQPAGAVPVASAVTPDQDFVKGMQYPNADVKDILAVYERLTGKKVVFDNTVQGPINIVISQQVPREEAIKIIEINLLLNGFSIVPEDSNIVKVTGIGRNPRGAGVPVYSDANLLPEGDRVVSFLFKLNYADPLELQQTLGIYVAAAPTGYTSMIALPKAQSLLVTENTAVIRTLIQIIKTIDVRPAEVVSEFIPLERADAKDVLEKLEKIFATTPSSGTPGGVIPRAPIAQPIPGQPGGAAPSGGTASVEVNAGGPSEESLILGKIKLTADIRTNRIHVVTRPDNLPFVKKLVKEFDDDTQFAEPKIRPLKFVLAGDVLPVVVKAITEPGVKPDDAGATGPGGQRTTGATGGATGATTGATGGTGGNRRGGGGAGGGGTSLSISEELQTPSVDTTPQAVTVGNSKIIADRNANTIIVLGNDAVVQKVFKVIDKMDVRAPQVVLHTVIGELRLNKEEDFGFDIVKFINSYGGSLISGSGSTTTSAVPTTVLDNFASLVPLGQKGLALGATGGLSQFAVATSTLAGTVKALESTGRFRVTQRPMVFAKNNKKAIIASGEEIAVPGQSLTSLNTGANGNAAVSSTVEFRQVALQLEVVPLINSDREVSLDILQKIDDLSGTNDIVGGNAIPRINTRYIRTNVSVADGETIVLGGLIKKRDEKSRSGPLWISRVPLLGGLLSTRSKIFERDELIILIRPVVANTPIEVLKNSEREQERMFIAPDLETTLDPQGTQIRVPRHGIKPAAPKPQLRSAR